MFCCFRIFCCLITLLLPALAAQAEFVGYELTIYGGGSGETGTMNGTTIPAHDNVPLFKLTNDPLSASDITNFSMTIGDTNYNFDSAVVSTSGSVTTSAGVAPMLNSPDAAQGALRSDAVDYDFSGFPAGSQFAFSTDVDGDGTGDTILDFESIFWNNSGSNSTITVTFGGGQSLILETPDQPDGTPTSYTFSQTSGAAVPAINARGTLALIFLMVFAGAGILIRRGLPASRA